ncbi:hypothetical protein JMG10_14280 [Nostoc ellipsosporum NOK]|nr:hypothetical protein [Nostoc ellipsosporum NOK]
MKGFIAVVLLALFGSSIPANAQEAKEKPFTFNIGGVTITGTYSEGSLYKSVKGGVSILWGLISWGSSETTDCRPGNSICRIETIINLSGPGIKNTQAGEACFEEIKTWASDQYPIVISLEKDRRIRFMLDLDQVSSALKMRYDADIYRQETPILLGPELTRYLGLYDGPDEMGYLIPPGEYQVEKDGRIRSWSWQIPSEPQKQVHDW